MRKKRSSLDEEKEQKNIFHHHEVRLQLYVTRMKHLSTSNQQTSIYLTKLHKNLQITLTSSCNIVALFKFKAIYLVLI